LVGVVHNAQHAQGATARVHGGGMWGEIGVRIPMLFLYCPVDEEEDGDKEDGVGRVLLRCWLCGMPRCADR
jgi:hypothetical protein